MRRYNKVKWCPICNQGWIEIVKDISTGEMFCCCSECESEWDTPEKLSVEDVNSPEKYGEITYPSDDEIMAKGWNVFVQK